jgi:N-carbamoylputrescine amidase
MEGSCRSFKVGLVQMSMSADPEENLEKATRLAREAAEGGAEIVCLPELYRTQYFPQAEDPRAFELSEPIPGPSTEAFSRLARGHRVSVLVPVFERRAAGLYHNSVAVVRPDGTLAGLYRKMHVPDDPGFYEKFYFAPGDLGFRAFDVGPARVGVLVCWDQWYPEAARLVALRGASIVFYPTAIGWHPSEKAEHGESQREAWRTIQRAHAIANGVYVAAANRIGHEAPAGGEGGIEFWGSSFLCDPFGIVLAEASASEETILIGEVHLDRIEQVRRNWPFLRDRRTDAYGGLDRRLLDET